MQGNYYKFIKKVAILLMMVMMCSVFTACSDSIPELSDDEMKQVEEYAASLLLKYDKNYKQSILDEEAVQAELEELERKAQLQAQIKAQKEAEQAVKENEEAEQGSGEGSGDAISSEPVYANIAQFLGYDNVAIDISNIVVSANYPSDIAENDWQGVARAANGNKLVAFEFDVNVIDGDSAELDIPNKGIKASVKIDGRYTKAPLTTLLANDFMFYRGTVNYGETAKIVLIIEMPEMEADEMTSAVLTLKCGGEKIETTLL